MSRYAIIVSRFNENITSALALGAENRFREKNINSQLVDTFYVPGAIEIPLTAQLLAKRKQYFAIICLGAVIRGDTDHYDYVCQQVSYGCQKVMLDFEVPIIFGILTTHTEQQALERVGGKHGHKGIEAVDAALEMTALLIQIN